MSSADARLRKTFGPLFEMLERNQVKQALEKLKTVEDKHIDYVYNNRTLLGQACCCGVYEVASELVKNRGANVNAPQKQSALFLAVVGDIPNIVRLLVHSGADLQTQDGWEALDERDKDCLPVMRVEAICRAAREGDLDQVRYCLQKGCPPDAKDTADWKSAMGWAIKMGRLSVVELLVLHKIDLNKECGGGNSPLSYACYWDNERILRFLLKSGADVDGKFVTHNDEKLSALEYAEKFKPKYFALLLSKHTNLPLEKVNLGGALDFDINLDDLTLDLDVNDF